MKPDEQDKCKGRWGLPFQPAQQTGHYLTWRETVQDWMAEKRIGKRYVNLMPNDEDFKQ